MPLLCSSPISPLPFPISGFSCPPFLSSSPCCPGTSILCPVSVSCEEKQSPQSVMPHTDFPACKTQPRLRVLPFGAPLLAHKDCLLRLLPYFVCCLYGPWDSSAPWAVLGSLGLSLLPGFRLQTAWWGEFVPLRRLDLLSSPPIVCPL